LKVINLAGCIEITNDSLSVLGRLCSLEVLTLGYCWNCWDVCALGALTNLKQLHLKDCRFVEDVGILALTGLRLLEHIDLGGLKQITDAALGGLATLEGLRQVDLDGCERIGDAGLASLARLPNLADVNCSGAHRVTDEGVVALSRVGSLTALNLNGFLLSLLFSPLLFFPPSVSSSSSPFTKLLTPQAVGLSRTSAWPVSQAWSVFFLMEFRICETLPSKPSQPRTRISSASPSTPAAC
jgi:hypothetical protein